MGTDDLGRDILARMLYGGRISLAVGFAAMLMAITVGVIVGAIAGIARGWVDTALMWVTDLFLSLPQLPLLLLLIFLFRDPLKKPVRAGTRHLHPDRGRHRRLSLDAGGTAGARAVLQPAREGVRRGRARARRQRAAAGGAPHPAQQPGAGDRRRVDRCRRGHHRREHAVLPGPGLPARHPDLGPHPLRRPRLHGHRGALGPVSRHGHLHHRADDQLHRRRSARRARPARGVGCSEPCSRSRVSRPTSRPTTAGCTPSTAST